MTTAVRFSEEATSKYAQAGDIRVHYNEVGEGDAVIFLHGGGPGATSWSNFFKNVGAVSEQYRCLLVDQPGFGKSDSVTMAEPRNTVNARAVKDLMDALGIEKASLIGNSMGGATSITFAIDYPDRIDKLIIMGSGGGGSPPLFAPSPTEGIKILNEVFETPSVEGLRRLINVMLFDGSMVPDEVLEQRFKTIMDNPDHLTARRNSVTTQRDVSVQLAGIGAPTLVLHGRNDRVVPLENGLRLVSSIPNSRLVVLNQCGHWAQYEHSDVFNRLVTDFLANS
jgi:2-hydroxy-6-oxonona-2,4-dienedioate hydrolase/2,6-dioxo-6-phenylhexa-3-enoate hydrolase